MKNVRMQLLFLSLIIWGCTTESVEIPDHSSELNSTHNQNVSFADNEKNVFSTFKITIENIGEDQELVTLFSPGVYVIQKQKSEPLFSPGMADFQMGLENIAEDGNPNPLFENLENHPKIRERGIFAIPVGTSSASPITPGGKYEFYVTAKPKDNLNFVTMYAQSNDVFIAPGPVGISLFDDTKTPMEENITNYLYYWDAGTEVNQEPGFGDYQAPRQPGPNTGPDEHGVVHLLDDGYYYPPLEDIIKVTIAPQPNL